MLSPLGEEQARRLGAYFASQGIDRVGVLSGAMRRQHRTAELICEALNRSHRDVDDQLNEFSLASIYGAFARRMVEESLEFARDFEEMQEALRRDPHTVRGATGRCDLAMIRAWMDNRYQDYTGETWSAFRNRIESRFASLEEASRDQELIVVTSATPIAIITAAALELTNDKFLGILGSIYNSGITTVRIRKRDVKLFTFNSAPHLPIGMKTFR